MGSLPNLRSLNDDPSTTYSYVLVEPEDLPKRSYGCGVAAFNSQHNVDRYRADQKAVERRFQQLLGENKAGGQCQGGKSVRNHSKVRQTRSTGTHHPCSMGPTWEEYLLELQNSTTSPLSSRSSRSNVMFAVNHGSMRRRDSLNSSGGASSVRRLIAVVRSTPSRLGPVYSRRVLWRNFAALCLGHLTISAALLPLISLQSSVSTWWWGEDDNAGSLLLASSFVVAALSTLVSPYLIQLIGCNWTLVIGYIGGCIFFVAHLYPTLRWLIPAYLMLGLCLGPLSCARATFVTTLASKLIYVLNEEEEVHEVIHGDIRIELIKKLTRGLQLSQDLGMVLGNLVAWLFLQYSWPTSWEEEGRNMALFEENGGERVCGVHACPLDFSASVLLPDADVTSGNNSLTGSVVPCRTTALLAGVFVGCGLVSVALTAAFTDRIRLYMYQDPLERPACLAILQSLKVAFRDPRLQLAAPLSIFIGLQQGFIHADFSKWYVVCSLGVPYISLVFFSMACLQTVAAFTLSLLMQYVPRALVIATGLVFHACLLLVLGLWKPADDDSALLYVISAAWGVCNAIWEMLNFTVLLYVQPDSSWQSAFVHAHFFRFVGLALALGLHDSVCTAFKLYSLGASLLLAVTPHIWLEWKLDPRRKAGLTSF